jgi:pyrroloquinoline-quinone synthase
LFLEYPRGLGMSLRRFENVRLLPNARRYRAYLDAATGKRGWDVAAAVVTIFVEGTVYERGEIDPRAAKRPVTPLAEHPLVRYYGLPIQRLALTKAHRGVEGEHRAAAWRIILNHVPADRRKTVIAAMRTALARWLAFRDDVAKACGLHRG